MLENLNQIDWAALGAPEIPDLFHIMQQEDDPKYNEAYNKLWQLIMPDYIEESFETLLRMMNSQVPILVTPLLVELLPQESITYKIGSLLELLTRLAGYWYLKNAFPENDPRRNQFKQWERQINNAIRQGIPIYQQHLNHPQTGIRDVAQELLDRLEATNS